MPLIVFDLDGTLVDSANDIYLASNRFLRWKGKPERSLEDIRSYIGRGVSNLLARLLGTEAGALGSAEYSKNLTTLQEFYNAETATSSLYPNVEAALTRLKDEGHQLAICTNKPSMAARAVVSRLQIGVFFDALIGGNDTPACKPDPAHLTAVADKMGSDVSLFVGDSEIDSQTASRACVPFILYTGGYHQIPTSEIDRLEEFGDFAKLTDIIARSIN